VGILKDSTLMGTFPIPPPDIPPPFVASINMISTSIHETPASHDPWIVVDPNDYLLYGKQIPLSPVESAYQAIQSTTPPNPSLGDSSPDPFHVVFPMEEMIMSVMSMEITLRDDGHHCSTLFLEQYTIESYQRILTLSTVILISFILESTHDVLYEGNLSNIFPTILLDISIKPRVIENVHIRAAFSSAEVITYTAIFQDFRDVFSWSYEEMQSIDPNIVVHEIKTYPNAKPIRKRIFKVYPRKAATIKLEVEKLLKASFIYPVSLTDCVSNLVPINKKQGTICVCVDYMDINKTCPKENFPTPFIDQIIEDCTDCKIFFLMDSFSGYN
jgi:hypothetical protein